MPTISIADPSVYTNNINKPTDGAKLLTDLNSLVSEVNNHVTRLNVIESTAATWGGVKTFTNGLLTDAITERTSSNGTLINSVKLKSGGVFLLNTGAYTPTTDGEIGYDNVTYQYKGRANSVNRPFMQGSLVSTRSSNTIFGVADIFNAFGCTSTFTQTFTAAATLGNGWSVNIRNDGTGLITLDPNGSETIDGSTTMIMYPGEAFTVICDGTNFKTVGRSRGYILIQTQSASASTTIDFTIGLSSDFNYYVTTIVDLVPGTDDVDFWMRVSEDAGANWKSGAGDYAYDETIDTSNVLSTGAAQVLLTFSSAGQKLGSGAGDNSAYVIGIANPAGTARVKLFDVNGVQAAGTTSHVIKVAGQYKGTTNAINGIRFLTSSGNIASGVFRLYGVRA